MLWGANKALIVRCVITNLCYSQVVHKLAVIILVHILAVPLNHYNGCKSLLGTKNGASVNILKLIQFTICTHENLKPLSKFV